MSEMVGDDVRSSLIVGAIERIAESGYAATQLADVARAAGVSESVVADEFSDQAELLSATAGYLFGEVSLFVGSAVVAAADGLPKIDAYIRTMLKYVHEHRTHVRVLTELLASQELIGPPGEQPMVRRRQSLEDLVIDGQRKGLLGPVDPKAVAIVIGGAIDGLIAEGTIDATFSLPAAAEELVGLTSSLTKGATFVVE